MAKALVAHLFRNGSRLAIKTSLLDGSALFARSEQPLVAEKSSAQFSDDRSFWVSSGSVTRVTGLSILRRLLYCLKLLRITAKKKLFTTQHEAFQADAYDTGMSPLRGWATKTCHSASSRRTDDN
jgi:hypothetical protein